MSNINSFIELDRERADIQKEMEPLQSRLTDVMAKIREINENLTYSEKKFIATKLYEAMSSDEKERLEEHRKRLSDMMNNAYSYSAMHEPFDPFYDKWTLIGYLEDGNKIKIRVSCTKNEGSISGLMTFLDVHETTWLDRSELRDVENKYSILN